MPEKPHVELGSSATADEDDGRDAPSVPDRAERADDQVFRAALALEKKRWDGLLARLAK